MYRRGLPAALFVTLALAGVYWVLNSPNIPAAKSSAAVSAAAEIERPNVPPEPGEKPPGEPLVRALQPAPKSEGKEPEPASERASAEGSAAPFAPAAPDAPEPAQARRPPAEPRAPQGTNSALGSAARVGPTKAPGATSATRSGAERPALTSTSQNTGEEKQNRPGFLRKLDSQDYGGRE
jgi:hypothetical protein